MYCAYTRDAEDILTFKTFKIFKKPVTREAKAVP
jgi:hypothetical protein